MNFRRFLLVAALAAAGVACSSTQYIIGTKTGELLVSYGRPSLDEKTGLYTYKDAEGKTATISKDSVGQIMER